MTKKQIITILAPYSWSAAVVPIIVTTLFYLHMGGTFRVDLFITILLAGILAQSFTNIVNCYSDFKSGLDNPDTIFDSAGSVIVGEGVDPLEVKKLMVWVFFISALPIAYLSFIRGPVVLLLSIIGILSGLIYSAGPYPISATPFGEIYSGIIDGFFISTLSYYVYSGSFSPEIFMVALPVVLWVSTMTFTNSICDMDKDREYRTTLALFLGKDRAITVLKLFYLGMFISLVLNIILGLLPPSMFLILIAIPTIKKRLDNITKENTTMKNKFPIMGLSCGSGIIFFKLYSFIMVVEILLKTR